MTAAPPTRRLTQARRMARNGWAALELQWSAAPAASIAALVLTLGASVSPALSATLVRRLLNDLASHRTGSSTVVIAVLATSVGSAFTVLSYISQYPNAVIGQKLIVEANQRLFRRVADFRGLRPFEDPVFHDRLSLAEQAAQQVSQATAPLAQSIVSAVVILLTFTATLLAIWPVMGILLILSTIPMVFIRVSQGKAVVRVSTELAPIQRRTFFFRYLLTDPRAAKEMRLFGFAGLMHERLIQHLRSTARAQIGLQRQQILGQSSLGIISGALSAVGVVVVVRGVQSGRFGIGDVTLFLAAIASAQGAISGIILQATRAHQVLTLFENFVGVVDAPDDLSNGVIEADALKGGITFEDVWFRYQEHLPWVFRGLDLHIPAGQTVGIVGLNGEGKSTLVKLLCRFYDPDIGRITWDGRDMREFELGSLRRHLSAVFQDYAEYDLTAAENIGLGDVEALFDRCRIQKAAQEADVAYVVEELPNGYQTLLSRTFHDTTGQETSLSVGQWQRIALARALMRDKAHVMVLDEPNSALDALAEKRLYAALRSEHASKTIVLISHRLSALRHADTIVAIKDGRVVEVGPHDDLLARGGEYARLFRAQAEPYQLPHNSPGEARV